MGAGCVCRRRRRGAAVPDAIVACVQLPPRSFTPGGLGAPRDCCVVAALVGEQTVLRRGLRRHPRQPPATPATNTVSRLPRTRKCICKHASMPLLLIDGGDGGDSGATVAILVLAQLVFPPCPHRSQSQRCVLLGHRDCGYTRTSTARVPTVPASRSISEVWITSTRQ